VNFSVRHHRTKRWCRSAASFAFSSAVLTSLLSTKMLEALGSAFCLQLAVASLISCLLGFLTLFVSFHWRLHRFRQFPSPTPHWLLRNTDLLLNGRINLTDVYLELVRRYGNVFCFWLAGRRGHRYGGRRAPQRFVLVGHAGIRCDGRPHRTFQPFTRPLLTIWSPCLRPLQPLHACVAFGGGTGVVWCEGGISLRSKRVRKRGLVADETCSQCETLASALSM
jgi:hypothetical protein